MLKTIDKVTFDAQLHLEGSFGASQLGKHPCSMELFDIDGHISIEFIAGKDGCVGVEHIGLTFKDKTLVDYDGVFSIPREAINLLRKNGYHVPRDFE